ncbi:MAG: anti-sigma factor [Dehalococcoidia bacterium]|nr:anti-sigma factor [Dehalococcoidia bacterium]
MRSAGATAPGRGARCRNPSRGSDREARTRGVRPPCDRPHPPDKRRAHRDPCRCGPLTSPPPPCQPLVNRSHVRCELVTLSEDWYRYALSRTAQPDGSRRAALLRDPGAFLEIFVEPSTSQGTIRLGGLPAQPGDEVYQVWLIQPAQQPVPLCVVGAERNGPWTRPSISV